MASKYPNLKTYILESEGAIPATGRMTINPKGIHVFITFTTLNKELYIRQYFSNNPEYYFAYYSEEEEILSTSFCNHVLELSKQKQTTKRNPSGDNLRIFRIALSVPGELAQEQGWADKASATIQLTNFLSEINTIYERDLAIRFTMVAGNEDLIF